MRDEAKKHGEELYLCRFESHGLHGEQYLKAGFDAAVDFQPYMGYKSHNPLKIFKTHFNSLYSRFYHKTYFSMVDDYEKYGGSVLRNPVYYK